ncbi:MAG: endonuclease/exonuclease/phosphatase family protein [Pseudomonadota bacterium]
MSIRISIPALLLAAMLACTPTPPPDEPEPTVDRSFKVLTWNLYLGTAFESLFSVSSIDQVPAATAAAWAAVQATDFADRAEAIADRIAAAQPHLVGLQEVELYRLQSPSDGWTGTPATTVVLDFLDLLQQALVARGQDYVVAVSMDNVDFEAPMTTTGGEDDIRITDRDVVLARSDVVVENPAKHHYTNMTRYPIPGTPFAISVPKAWVSVELLFKDRRSWFVNTHLEIPGSPNTVQQGQVSELVQALAATDLPTVLVGDFNAAPGNPVYQSVVEAGFDDTWLLAGQSESGTCCQAADLGNTTSSLHTRIDHVFLRGGLDATGVAVQGVTPDQRSPGGLWPSDHAGVAVTVN